MQPMKMIRAIFLACGVLVGCNPYDPNLPPVPFQCGTSEPVCPSGYTCNGEGNCEQINEGPDAPPTPSDARCLDLAESPMPNDAIPQATIMPVWGQFEMIVLEGLTLCPITDTDFFRVSQPTVCGGASDPPCPNLDVLVQYTGNPPALQIQGATGSTITFGGLPNPPIANTIKAVVNNVAQGQYYVVVSVQDMLTTQNYRLTIDGTRAQ